MININLVGEIHSFGELPVHGVDGWELAKYEWRDGRGRFLYVRGTEETQEVWRDQPKHLVGGAK